MSIIRLCSLTALSSLLLSGSAQAIPIVFTACLSGTAEFPANNSPGTGFTTVTYDPEAHTLRVEVTFSGLLGTTTASHIHGPTAAPLAGTASVATTVPTFPGFPLGVTSGTYDHTLDLTLASSFNPAFVTAHGGTVASAEAALAAALLADEAYLNIHSTEVSGGEIRGFLTVPDAGSTLGLLCFSLAGLGGARRMVRIMPRD